MGACRLDALTPLTVGGLLVCGMNVRIPTGLTSLAEDDDGRQPRCPQSAAGKNSSAIAF